jgi:hypothetical protein
MRNRKLEYDDIGHTTRRAVHGGYTGARIGNLDIERVQLLSLEVPQSMRIRMLPLAAGRFADHNGGTSRYGGTGSRRYHKCFAGRLNTSNADHQRRARYTAVGHIASQMQLIGKPYRRRDVKSRFGAIRMSGDEFGVLQHFSISSEQRNRKWISGSTQKQLLPLACRLLA